MNNTPVFFYSIRFRLVGWFTLILSLVLVGFSTFIYFNQARDVRGDALYRLQRKLGEIEKTLKGYPNSSPVLQPSDVLILFDSNGGILTSQGITSSDQIIVLIDQAFKAQKSDDSESGHIPGWIQEWSDTGELYYFTVKEMVVDSKKGYVLLGSPFDPYGLMSRLFVTLFLGNLFTIGLALGGGWWIADRAMRPVHTITQAARAISETDLNRRLNISGKDELAELAGTFDDMLARLKNAFERQKRFVADASHELRTPLTIVNLETSRALAAPRSNQEYRRALEVIQSENEFMSRLVHDLLTLARMDSGQLRMEMRPIDLSDVSLEVIERLAPLAEKRGVKLEAGDLPEVMIMGDRQYLLQMISNLVENGIKYSGEGDDRYVRVGTGITNNAPKLRVANSGQGIPSEHLPHLFDRFYRVDESRERGGDDEQGGTGLGLAIVDWIAKAHSGEVNVESIRGEETVFEIWFKPA